MFTRQFFLSPARSLPLAAAAMAAMVAAPASAQSTTTMPVSATVTNNCTVSTTPVLFGNVDVTTGSSVDSTGGMAVTCTNGTPWSASADAGQTANATTTARQMSSGNGVLNYALYTNLSRQVLWGDGSNGTSAMTGVGTGSTQNEVIYASILPGQQNVPAGTYLDQVTVTIAY